MKRINVLLVIMVVLAITAVSPRLWKHSHKPPLNNIYIEANRDFTYKGQPIHPMAILQLQLDVYKSNFSNESRSDLNILEEKNLYERLPLQIDGNKICMTATKPEEAKFFNVFLYEYAGKTDDGLHIVLGRDCFEDGIYSSLLFIDFEEIEETNALNQVTKKTYIILKKGYYLGFMAPEVEDMAPEGGIYQEIDLSEESSIKI